MLLVQLTRLAWSPRLASQRLAPPRFTPPRCSTVCTLADPPILAEAEAFFAERDVRLRSVQAGTPGSRTHSKIAVRAAGADGCGVTVGMFRPGTHDAVPCALDESCHLPHHPAINQCIAAVTAALEREELSAYDETRRQGTLRYLQCSVERSSRRVQLTLVANAPSLEADPALVRFASALWSRHGGGSAGAEAGAEAEAEAEADVEALQLHSIWVNLNPSKVNNILAYAPGAWQLLHADEGGGGGGAPLLGGGALLESFPSGAAFVLSPWVFRQASATSTLTRRSTNPNPNPNPNLTPILTPTLTPGQPRRLRRHRR
jgi:hypothetical protein